MHTSNKCIGCILNLAYILYYVDYTFPVEVDELNRLFEVYVRKTKRQ